jgi:hypothetical protein
LKNNPLFCDFGNSLIDKLIRARLIVSFDLSQKYISIESNKIGVDLYFFTLLYYLTLNEKINIMNRNKIFISHSSLDKIYVQHFVEQVLKLGLDIPANRIFCSSLDGHGIQSGEYIPDKIREEILNANLIILFISKNYKQSEICLNEAGASWVTLDKRDVIPIILPDTNFNELGVLDLGRLAIEITQEEDILKFIQDSKSKLNNDFNLTRVIEKTRQFLSLIKNETKLMNISVPANIKVDEWDECFTNNLIALDDIIRSILPTQHSGIHQIDDIKKQEKILHKLNKAPFIKHFWYRYSGGDFYVKNLKQLSNGNWLICNNWEIKITEMWISMSDSTQYEFILIKSEGLNPFQIDSDVKGEGYHVGILQDGTIISEIERNNGYAIINDETIKVDDFNCEYRYRRKETNWVFLSSEYHKVGYNYKETIEFCKKLDNGKVIVNEQTLMKFQNNLNTHPTVLKYL